MIKVIKLQNTPIKLTTDVFFVAVSDDDTDMSRSEVTIAIK